MSLSVGTLPDAHATEPKSPGVLSTRTLQDPTRPPRFRASPAVQSPVASKLALSSILSSNGRRVAMINNRPMLEGTTHAGITVARIHRDSVVVRLADGSAKTLTLLDTRVKKEFK